MNKRKIIKWLALLLWMLVIFLFSHQPNSGQATHGILEKLFPILKNSSNIDILNVIIRKCAHMTEYFILTLLAYQLLKEYKIKKSLVISILICFIYACTDEFHQSFVAGRSGLLTDCIIDTLGGFIFIIMNKINIL